MYAQAWGRSYSNPGNGPEVAFRVCLWRALWLWRLKFLVRAEAAVGPRQGRLGEAGQA